jgi:hypothetical protein
MHIQGNKRRRNVIGTLRTAKEPYYYETYSAVEMIGKPAKEPYRVGERLRNRGTMRRILQWN